MNMRALSSIVTLFATPVTKAWNPINYAFDPRIHNFGNHGVLGKVHAKLAPAFTKMIDNTVYSGVDIRQKIVNQQGTRQILDLGCGTGFSTSDIFGSVGVDASEEMINEAMKQFPGKVFEVGHAEYYEPEKEFDIVTCMFLMHEAPSFARKRIINNAIKIAKEKVVIVDIAPEYVPKLMKLGEPYIDDYLKNIRKDLPNFYEEVIIPGHVHAWFYDKPNAKENDTEPEIAEMKVKRRKITRKKYKNYNQAYDRRAKIDEAKEKDADDEVRYYKNHDHDTLILADY